MAESTGAIQLSVVPPSGYMTMEFEGKVLDKNPPTFKVTNWIDYALRTGTSGIGDKFYWDNIKNNAIPIIATSGSISANIDVGDNVTVTFW